MWLQGRMREGGRKGDIKSPRRKLGGEVVQSASAGRSVGCPKAEYFGNGSRVWRKHGTASIYEDTGANAV